MTEDTKDCLSDLDPVTVPADIFISVDTPEDGVKFFLDNDV
jgi:hypothetical protein